MLVAVDTIDFGRMVVVRWRGPGDRTEGGPPFVSFEEVAEKAVTDADSCKVLVVSDGEADRSVGTTRRLRSKWLVLTAAAKSLENRFSVTPEDGVENASEGEVTR